MLNNIGIWVGSGSGTLKIRSRTQNKSFQIHNTNNSVGKMWLAHPTLTGELGWSEAEPGDQPSQQLEAGHPLLSAVYTCQGTYQGYQSCTAQRKWSERN